MICRVVRLMTEISFCNVIFFFNDTATTEIYTLSLHDALPIYEAGSKPESDVLIAETDLVKLHEARADILTKSVDRKSTRLNSSHGYISYAVFCLKKKTTISSPRLRSGYWCTHRWWLASFTIVT